MLFGRCNRSIMHSSTGIKKQIKIRRSDNGAPVVVEIPGGSKINESNQDILTEPINLKALLDKALGIEVPIDKPIPPPLPPPLPMTPLYDKFLPLPTKPKVTMENLKDWVDKMEAMPGPNQGQTRSTERLKKRFLPISSPVPTKISDLNMSIKRVALKSPDGKTGTSPKVVKIVKMDKSSGSENPTKSVIKIVKPPSADLMTNLESTSKPSVPKAHSPPPLKDENLRKFRYCCLKCQKRFTRINGAQLPFGEERDRWFERLSLPPNETTSKYALICSEHFEEKDIFENRDGEKRAAPGALPKAVKIKSLSTFDRKKYPRLGCVKCKKRFDLVNGACFPKLDAEILAWKKMLDLDDNVKVNFKTVVCADHFNEKDIFISRNGELRVTPNALPMDHRKSARNKKKDEILKKVVNNVLNHKTVPEMDELKVASEKEKWVQIKSIRPFFRPLPKYKALGEPDNYDAMEDELEEPGPSSTIIKEEPSSDKEDEEEKSARQKEVKVLKKGSKKEKQFEVNIKEEPIDFDERVDEPFIVQPSGRADLDLVRIKEELQDESSTFEFITQPVPEIPQSEEPVLLSISHDDDEEDEDLDPETIQNLALSLFTSPKASTSAASSSQGPINTTMSMRSLREAVVELFPDCIKEHVEKFGSKFEALKFAGIMSSAKGKDYYYCSVCGVDLKFSALTLQGVTTHLKSQRHKQLFKLYSKLYATMKCTQGFRGIQSSARGPDFLYCALCMEQVNIGQIAERRNFNLATHILSRQHFESYMSTSKVAKKNAVKMGLHVELREKKKKKKKSVQDIDFKAEYSEIYDGILPSTKGPTYFYCKLCKIDATLEKLGEHAIYVHTKKPRHQKALNTYLKNIDWLEKRRHGDNNTPSF